MEYISVEEFLKQPLEVQEVLTKWFNENISEYDLVQDENVIMLYKDYLERGYIENDSYALFTEGKLRQFIENNTHKITIIEFDYDHYNIIQCLGSAYITEESNLLQAYWKVACQIASKED